MMRCTNCSKPVVPVVAVDIDGTLGDYHTHFLEFAQDYLNEGQPWDKIYDGGEGFKEWFCRSFGVDERTWSDIKLAYRQGAQKRSMPIFPGAVRLCQTVKEEGAELWLTTTRPYLRLDNIDPDTRFWLHSRGITDYDGLLYDEFKYARLAESVDKERVVAVVDDLREMFDAAAKHFGWRVPLLHGTKWNRAYKGDAYNLSQIRQEVAHRIQAWKEEYDNGVHTVESASSAS